MALVALFTPRELRVRYRQSLLNAAWVFIAPVVVLAVYGTVLTQSFDVTGNGTPYLSSAWAGLVLWTFFASAMGGAVSSLLSSADLLTKLYFPREAIPLSVVGASMLELAVGLLALVPLALIQGVRPGAWALATPIAIIILLLWTSALAVFASLLTAFVRDTVHLVHLVLRVGFFATPVVYDATFLPGRLAVLAQLNPIAVAITSTRDTFLRNIAPDWALVLPHLALGALALVGAVAYARAVESRVVDVI